MSQLDYRVITMTVASGTTTSNEVDLGRTYRKVYLDLPASLVGNTKIMAASEAGGTMKTIINSGASVSIASSVSNAMVDLQDLGYSRHMVIVATTAPTADVAYKVICAE